MAKLIFGVGVMISLVLALAAWGLTERHVAEKVLMCQASEKSDRALDLVTRFQFEEGPLWINSYPAIEQEARSGDLLRVGLWRIRLPYRKGWASWCWLDHQLIRDDARIVRVRSHPWIIEGDLLAILVAPAILGMLGALIASWAASKGRGDG